MPSLGRMLKATLSATYDYLQLVVVANVLWCAAWIVPLLVSAVLPDIVLLVIAVAGALAALTVGPATLGLAELAHRVVTRDDPGLRHFFHGYSRFFWRGVSYFLVNAVVVGGCLVNVGFYTTVFAGRWLWVVGVLWVYVLIFWGLMQIYAPQLIVRADLGVARALKLAARAVAGNIAYTTVVMLEIAVVGALVALPVLLGKQTLMGLSVLVAFFLFAGFVSMLSAGAVDDLMQYQEAEEEQPGEDSEEPSTEEEATCA
ncbi:MAG: hypothetical protein ACE5R4_13215 [Armatimonadota bacterium]